MPKKINEYGPRPAGRPAHFGRRQINGRRNHSEIRGVERVSCAQTFRATFLRSPRSTDHLDPAVVWEHDDQMSGPSGGRATPSTAGDGERPPLARVRLQPPPRSWPGHRARRPALRGLVVLEGGVPRSPVKSSRRQTPACAGGRGRHRTTVAAAKGYDARKLVTGLRAMQAPRTWRRHVFCGDGETFWWIVMVESARQSVRLGRMCA